MAITINYDLTQKNSKEQLRYTFLENLMLPILNEGKYQIKTK